MRNDIVAGGVLSLGLAGAAVAGVTINVPGDQPSIQAAINAASFVDADEIIVQPGTYFEKIDLGGKVLTLRSADGPEVTTINAAGLNDSVIRAAMGEQEDTIIDGFTITGGSGRLIGSKSYGGGMYHLASRPTVRNCVFIGNSASEGGAVYNSASGPVMANCIFRDNSSTGVPVGGGAIMNVANSNPVFMNCTMVDNSASAQGGGIYSLDSVALLINSVIWDNVPNQFGGNYAPIVRYSNVEGGFTGPGNVDADPLFVNAGAGNLRLQPLSPCIDRGDSTAVAAILFEDCSGDPRGVDDPLTPDRGVGVFAITVDMGAHEYQVPGGSSSCTGDITGPFFVPDGIIGFNDMLYILGNWGPCP